MFNKLNPPRLLLCSMAAVLLVGALFFVSPAQLPVMLYKSSLALLAGYVGYWLDRWLFPYARPDGYLAQEWRKHDADFPADAADYAVVPGYESIFAAALLRRALIVLGVMLAVGVGL